jgi:hypothetical protein
MANAHYHTIKCQFCDADIERTTSVKVGTCFECRQKRQKERDALRADEIRARRKEKYRLDNPPIVLKRVVHKQANHASL